MIEPINRQDYSLNRPCHQMRIRSLDLKKPMNTMSLNYPIHSYHPASSHIFSTFDCCDYSDYESSHSNYCIHRLYYFRPGMIVPDSMSQACWPSMAFVCILATTHLRFQAGSLGCSIRDPSSSCWRPRSCPCSGMRGRHRTCSLCWLACSFPLIYQADVRCYLVVLSAVKINSWCHLNPKGDCPSVDSASYAPASF